MGSIPMRYRHYFSSEKATSAPPPWAPVAKLLPEKRAGTGASSNLMASLFADGDRCMYGKLGPIIEGSPSLRLPVPV